MNTYASIISLIIPTRNRGWRLPDLFQSISGQKFPDDANWELLIVDNGSNDGTYKILENEASKGRLPIKILTESIPGKSRALNRGIAEAKGDIIIFADDDIKPTVAWIMSFILAARNHPNCQAFCGRVLPYWEGEMPQWLEDWGINILPEGLLCRCDFGEEEKALPQGIVPGGGNAAIRRSMIEKMGQFREDIGPGTDTPYSEDTEYMNRLFKEGHTFWYVPDALVYHINPVVRMTKQYAIQWVRKVARAQIIALKSELHCPKIGRVPRYLLRLLFVRIISFIAAHGDAMRFKHKLALMQTVGEIQGFLSLTIYPD